MHGATVKTLRTYVDPSLFQLISDDIRPPKVNIYMHFSVLELNLPKNKFHDQNM